MKTTGISTRIVVQLTFEPGEWLYQDDPDRAIVRAEVTWFGEEGWESSPNVWYVGRKKDGTWSKSERSTIIYPNAGRDNRLGMVPPFVRDALTSALLMVGRTALSLREDGDWNHPDLNRHFYVR